jgi:hypothetical protein
MSDNRDCGSEPGMLTVCGSPYGTAMIPAGGVGCDFLITAPHAGKI